MELNQVNMLVTELARLESEEAEAKKSASNFGQQADLIRAQLQRILEDAGVDSFDSTVGKIYFANRYQVRMPQTEEGRAALRGYLEKCGIFEQKWSFNHQSLNAWYKQEAEALSAMGIMPDIPGLDPVIEKTLNFRKRTK